MEGTEEQPYQQGDEVVPAADHMEGGATATIDSVRDTTVYMVNYIGPGNSKWHHHGDWGLPIAFLAIITGIEDITIATETLKTQK